MTRRHRVIISEEEWTHPECGPYEILFGNMSTADYEALPFATKRQGSAAYDGRGNRLRVGDRYPVFIHAAELADIGADQVHLLSALRRVWTNAHAV